MNSRIEALPVGSDVVLYSFPKCGRTWLRYMYLYLYGEHLAATHEAKAIERPKHIILIRRFEDALVSYYFEIVNRAGFAEGHDDLARQWQQAHQTGVLALWGTLARLPLGSAWRDRIDAARKEPSIMLLFHICADSFFEDYRFWLGLNGPKLVLRYEDLMADPLGNLCRVADFVGRAPAMNPPEAVERASFENMRKLELEGGGTRGILREGFWLPNLTTRDKDNPFALKTREGKVGNYRSHLSREHSRQIALYVAQHHAETAAAYGYSYGLQR